MKQYKLLGFGRRLDKCKYVEKMLVGSAICTQTCKYCLDYNEYNDISDKNLSYFTFTCKYETRKEKLEKLEKCL